MTDETGANDMTEPAQVVQHPTASRSLAVRSDADFWTPAQIAALRQMGIDEDVTNAELAMFKHLCDRTGLDPFAREIYLIGRRDRDAGRKVYTAQTGIDGYRHIAERTGQYDGTEGPYWCGEDGVWHEVWLSAEPPNAAKVLAYRRGVERPVAATALFSEFVPTRLDRNSGKQVPMGLWSKMPAHMLAKVAEALALRRAFPRLAGVYVDEEMHQADAAQVGVEREKLREAFRAAPWASPVAEIEGAARPEEQREPVDRDALLAELAEQARVLGLTVPKMCRRWMLAHKKNPEDASDEELAELTAVRRADVAAKLAERPAEPEQAPDAATAQPEPHAFEDNGNDRCKACGGYVDDVWHGTLPEQETLV